jgi:hypothetical protein
MACDDEVIPSQERIGAIGDPAGPGGGDDGVSPGSAFLGDLCA